MASMTRCGTCVPPGPSRKTAGWPFTVCDSEGNCDLTHAMSKVAVTSCSVLNMKSLLAHSSYEVGQHSVCGGLQPGIVLGNGQAGKSICFKIHYRRSASHMGERIAKRNSLRAHARLNAISRR